MACAISTQTIHFGTERLGTRTINNMFFYLFVSSSARAAKSTVVLKVEFLELLTDAMRTVEPDVLFTEVFANGSSAKVVDHFVMKTTLLDTHAFVFEVRYC